MKVDMNPNNWKKLVINAKSYTPERMVEIAFDDWSNGSVLHQSLWNFSNGRYSPNGEGQKIDWRWVKGEVWYKIRPFKEGEQKDYFLNDTWTEWVYWTVEEQVKLGMCGGE